MQGDIGLVRITSPWEYARIAGLCYLLIILLGIFGQIIVRGSYIVSEDAAATMQNIVASPLLWRWGIAGDIAMHLLDIPLMIILFLLLKPVNKTVALLALAFNIIQTAVLATNKLALMVPLIVVTNSHYVSALSPEQISAQIMLLIDIHNYGFGLGLIFFGFACLCYGYLIFNSGFFPKIIGVLIAIAGLCYLINSFVLILLPAAPPMVYPILGVCLLSELSLCLWLLLKGVDQQHWQKISLKN